MYRYRYMDKKPLVIAAGVLLIGASVFAFQKFKNAPGGEIENIVATTTSEAMLACSGENEAECFRHIGRTTRDAALCDTLLEARQREYCHEGVREGAAPAPKPSAGGSPAPKPAQQTATTATKLAAQGTYVPVTTCSTLDRRDDRDICYINAAVATKNVSICARVETESRKNECYVDVAFVMGDYTVCRNITNPAPMNKCFQQFPETSDPSAELKLGIQSVTGEQGDSIIVSGTITNTGAGAFYLTDINGTVYSSVGLDFAVSKHKFPSKLDPGAAYNGPLFTILIASKADPARYSAQVTIRGGKTQGATNVSETAEFIVYVEED